MIDKSFLDKLESLVEGNIEIITDKNGNEYSTKELHRVYADPRPAALKINSLDGIVDYLATNVDDLDFSKLLIHVVDHQTVNVLTDVHGEKNQRHTVLTSTLADLTNFPFDRYLGQEQFIIKCGSMFQNTKDLESIIKYTAKIDVDAKVQTADDGISQVANIKKSVSGVIADREAIPKNVKLKPFRTFQELDQPESEFLFRMSSDDGCATCALFEADGGAWVRKARKAIAEYLKDNLTEQIPVIS